RAERTPDGTPDWTICYVPGPRARAEFASFNGPTRRTLPSHRPDAATPPPTTRRGSARSAAAVEEFTPAYRLARRFQEKRHGSSMGVIDAQELDRACELLKAFDDDFDAAAAAVDLAAKAASS